MESFPYLPFAFEIVIGTQLALINQSKLHERQPICSLATNRPHCTGPRYFYRSPRHFGFDPLHGTRSDPAFSRGFQYPLTTCQRRSDSLLDLRVDPRAADRLAALGTFLSCPGDTGVYALLNDRPFEFSKYPEH